MSGNLQLHNIPPLFDNKSRALILGSFPSPASRAAEFFYMHPQNRFWRVLAAVFGENEPIGKESRAAFATAHRIALWDVVGSCEIVGASDASIKNAVPNDLTLITAAAPIRAIFTTGATATALYKKFWNNSSIRLPSPSPANCAVNFAALVASYSVVKSTVCEE